MRCCKQEVSKGNRNCVFICTVTRKSVYYIFFNLIKALHMRLENVNRFYVQFLSICIMLLILDGCGVVLVVITLLKNFVFYHFQEVLFYRW